MLLYLTASTIFLTSFALGETQGDIYYGFYNYSDYDDEDGDYYVESEDVTVTQPANDEPVRKIDSHFKNYQGDLVGWRDVTAVEFPYVVSIMHADYLVHVCTGILVTFEAVLTFMRCVIRKKTVAGKVSQKLAELSSITIVAGLDNMMEDSKDVTFRDVIDMVTPYPQTFKGHVVFLMVRPLAYTLHHRPVKFYSTDVAEMSRKFNEVAQRGFCEIVTWKDTVVCPDGGFLKPARLQAYRVKIGDPELCSGQTHRLGVRTVGEWSPGSMARTHCYVGMGGHRCGSSPGAPIVCRGAVYGLTSLGSSCSEFSDYGYFIPLNSSDVRLLYDRAYPIERSSARRNVKNVHPKSVLLHILVSLALPGGIPDLFVSTLSIFPQ